RFSIEHERVHARWGSGAATAGGLTSSSHERDVLLAFQFVSDRRTHATLHCRNFKKLLTVLRCVDDESSVRNNLENQIACGRERAAARSTATCIAPSFRFRHRIERDK